MEPKKTENVVAGLVGAFLGSLIGVACIVLLGQLGVVAAVSGLVMVVCALRGYAWFSGTMSRKGAVLVCALSVVMVYVANRVDFAVNIAGWAGVDVFTAFRAIDDLLEAGYLRQNAYWGNLVMLYLFTLLGAVPALQGAFRTGGAEKPANMTADHFVPTTYEENEDARRLERMDPTLEEPAPVREAVRPMAAIFLPFAGMFLGFVVLWLSISPILLEGLLNGAQTPEALLQGYSSWYVLLMLAVAAAVALPAVGTALAVRKSGGVPVTLAAVCIVFPLLIGGAMLAIEDVPGLFFRSREDLAQIESGQLQEVTVWLSPKFQEDQLPGPYTEGQPRPVTRYRGIGEDTGRRWVDFYLPDNLGFSLDPDALYRDGESVQWNEENARQYRLYLTRHFRLVVSAEPLDLPAQGLRVTV